MSMLSSATRRELDVQRYPWIVVLVVPLVAIFLQAYVPRYIPKFGIVNLPLLVTIYFSVGWRIRFPAPWGSFDRVGPGRTHQPAARNQRHQ